MEETGTGGGNFRKLYSRFLKEAATLTNNVEIKIVSEKLEESAKLWSDIAHLFLKISRTEDVEKLFLRLEIK